MRVSLGGIVLAFGLFAVSSAFAAPMTGAAIATSADQTSLFTKVTQNEAQCGPYGKAHNCTAIWSKGTRDCKCVGK